MNRNRQPSCVPSLHRAGNKQGNLGRYLFSEIGKQRDERQIIETRCRLKTWLRRPALKRRTVGGATRHSLPPITQTDTHMHMHHFTRSTTHSVHQTTKPNIDETGYIYPYPRPPRHTPRACFGCLAWRLDYFCGEPGGMIELDGPHPPPRRAFSTPPLAFR